MNKQRKKKLESALGLIRQAEDVIKEIRDEEKKAYNHLPDSIRNGKRGDAMDCTNHILDVACEHLDVTDDVLQLIWKGSYNVGDLPL